MPDAAQGPLPSLSAETQSVVNWEWFWRFLALVFFVSTSWVIWVLIEMNPSPLATPAAFAAASQAAKGGISAGPAVQTPRSDAAESPESSEAAPVLPSVATSGIPPARGGAGSAPPVDVRHLKRSEELSPLYQGKLFPALKGR